MFAPFHPFFVFPIIQVILHRSYIVALTKLCYRMSYSPHLLPEHLLEKSRLRVSTLKVSGLRDI